MPPGMEASTLQKKGWSRFIKGGEEVPPRGMDGLGYRITARPSLHIREGREKHPQ